MKTQHHLIFGILALSIGMLLAGIGIFEPEEILMALNLPQSSSVYIAFTGMGATGVGAWQLLPLLMNWRNTRQDLVNWAAQERAQALSVGLVCMAIGLLLTCSIIWATIGVVDTGSPIAVRVKPMAMAIIMGGFLVFWGGLLVKISISSQRQ